MTVAEYKLQVNYTTQESTVTIMHKQHGFWIKIGSFKIVSQKLFVLDKHDMWKTAEDLNDSETLFAIKLDKLQNFYNIVQDTLNDKTENIRNKFYIPIYIKKNMIKTSDK